VHSDGSLYGTERKRFSIEIAREVLQSIYSNSYRQQLKGAMRSKNRHSLFLITVLLVWICFPALLRGATSPVHLPVSLDYSFIRSVFVNQVFTQPGERAMPLNAGNGCARIELWQPAVGPDKNLLKLASNIKVSAGLPLGNTCVKMGEWEGYIELLQRIFLDEKSMQLGFETVDFRAFNQQRQRTSVDRLISDMIRTYLNPHLNQVRLDLAKPVSGIQTIVPLFFADQERSRVTSCVGTLKPSRLNIGANAIELDLTMDMDSAATPPGSGRAPLPQQEITRLVRAWEDWDAFAVHQIGAIMGQLVTEEERDGILETLLGTRHDFVEAFAQGLLDPSLLGRQFTQTWQALSPILKKHLTTGPTRSLLNYLTFFIASDILAAIDRTGSTTGLNVNRDALLRLARLLSRTDAEPTLSYSYAVQPDLRNFLGLGAALNESGPAFDSFEIELPEETKTGTLPGSRKSWSSFLLPLAYAANQPSDKTQSIQQWVMPKGDINPYLNRLKVALDQAALQVIAKSKLEPSYQPFYRQMVLATAWQETCWRQFVRSGSTVRCIVSYNQTSVGVMQINERVWRGIYRPESLRWDANYNMRAGCEVLDTYLRKYALKRQAGRELDHDTLARTLYAMYNGGPGQFQKFLTRNKNKSFSKIDQLFWEKWQWASTNQMDKISICLIGR